MSDPTKSVWLFLLSLIWISVSLAQPVEQFFEEANRAYADEDYVLAVDLYLKIISNGSESGEVYFNLGNAYYKLNNPGNSILYYEKAKLFLEGDPALDQNLRLAQIRIVDKIENIPVLFLEEWWLNLVHLFPMNTFLWLSLSLFVLLVAFIIFRILFSRRSLNRLIYITGTLFSIVLVLSISQIYEFETSRFGIILDDKVSVISEPNFKGTEVFILHEGTKVRINRALDKWLEITIPDGKTGWIETTEVGII